MALRNTWLRGAALGGMAAAVVSWGCGSTKMTGTARTGTEQLLLTGAWDRAVQQIDLRPLTGVPIFLDTTNLTAVDQGWVVSSLRQALLNQGALLREKKEEAQWVVEARVGAYGTDESTMLLGVPESNIPATIPGIPAGRIPEIPVMKKSDQQAVAKLALFAYDRASGQIVWTSGTVEGESNIKNVHIGGVGPIQSGTISKGTEFAGIPLPGLYGSAEAAPSAQEQSPGRPAGGPPHRSPGGDIPAVDPFAP
jgi:hypothetical protein